MTTTTGADPSRAVPITWARFDGGAKPAATTDRSVRSATDVSCDAGSESQRPATAAAFGPMRA